MNFTEEMRAIMKKDNRWRGHNVADEDGCYIHYLPTHGPNLYELKMVGGDHAAHMPVNGILYPQWAVGFDKPFEEKIGVEFENGRVRAVHGNCDLCRLRPARSEVDGLGNAAPGRPARQWRVSFHCALANGGAGAPDSRRIDSAQLTPS